MGLTPFKIHFTVEGHIRKDNQDTNNKKRQKKKLTERSADGFNTQR